MSAGSRRLGGLFLDLEHCSPDGNPRVTLALKYPYIAASCTIPLTRALVDHFILKGGYGRITGDVALMIIVTKLVDFGVFTKISKAREERLSSLYPPRKTGKHHNHFRVYHRAEIFYLAIEPETIDPSYCCDHRFVFRIRHTGISPLWACGIRGARAGSGFRGPRRGPEVWRERGSFRRCLPAGERVSAFPAWALPGVFRLMRCL